MWSQALPMGKIPKVSSLVNYMSDVLHDCVRFRRTQDQASLELYTAVSPLIYQKASLLISRYPMSLLLPSP